MAVRHLTLTWSVSRGRETYGYNICRLRDDGTGKVYRCMGGGYDMQGTVFAEWLQDQYQEQLLEIADRAYYTYGGSAPGYEIRPDGLYGMVETGSGKVRLDGGCGLESIERIAKVIGLRVKHIAGKRGSLVALMIATDGEDLSA